MKYICTQKLSGTVFLNTKTILKFSLNVCCFLFFVGQLNAQCFIGCKDTTVVCTVDIHPFVLGDPSTSGCSGNVSFTFEDVETLLSCNDPSGNIVEVARTWIGTDALGAKDTCIQTIFIKKAVLTDVFLEPNVTLYCENSSRPPSQTFFPEIGGFPLNGQNFCNIEAIVLFENLFDSCDVNVFKVSRRWLIRDSCANDSIELSQITNFADTLGPTITCADTLRFENETGFCHGDIQIPIPDIDNNCQANEQVFWEIPGIGFNQNSFSDVPQGIYDVNYTVTDCSGDTARCSTVLLVEDTETPTAVCREFTVISLTSAPSVEVPAISFDEGSYDHCDDVRFLVSRNALDFTERVSFDCTDLGIDSIMVILRVYERHNPDLFDQCMVFARLDDKLAPTINCPPNRRIDCEDDYSDLSIFGTATGHDACDFIITETVTENISNCGTGTIERLFTARDSSGNENFCKQIISIENFSPFLATNIVFPLDTIFTECDPEMHPDSLPTDYSRPVFINDPCSMIFVNYSDERFDASFPACFKVFRTWKILEMCSGQEFTHVQELKVMDNVKPDITCPPDTLVAANYDCSDTQVSLISATATDCDPRTQLSWSTDFDSGQGGDASGDFPNGITIIEFEAKDGCGNISTCKTSVVIRDLTAPIVKAHTQVSIELGQFAGGAVDAILEAATMNANSKDNCSAAGDLQFFIKEFSNPTTGLPTTQTIKYECADIGVDTVEFWAVDQAGNADFVVVEVDVQDNFDRCGTGSRTASISGFLKTEDGMPLKKIAVHLNSTNGQLTFTDSLGYYEFSDLEKGEDYTIAPFKNDAAAEGLTTFDLLVLGKHILNVKKLDSPFKLIAADANKSANISTTDIIAMRKVILRTADQFPTNTTWRFMDQSYQFRQPQKPLTENFPPERTISNLQGDILNMDFVGIKIGDLNGSIADVIQNRTTGEPLKIEFEKEGEDILWVKNIEETSFEGLQFSVEVELEQLEISEVISGEVSDFSKNNVSIFENENLLVSWSGGAAVSAAAGSRLFGFKIKNVQSVKPKISNILNPEVYSTGEVKSIEIEKSKDSISEPELVYELLQNKPNPFKQTTQIAFKLPEATTAKVTIFDLSGNVVKVVTGDFKPGTHQVRLNKNDLKNAGVYFYKLETPKFTSTKKMILL